MDLMGSAAQCLQETKEPPVSAIAIDSSTRDHVETPLKQLRKLMISHTMTRRNVCDCIVRAEFSEWNDIFIYVIKPFQEYSRTFQYLAATIQAHQKRIEKFLEDLPDDFGLSEEIRKLPRIWEERILIVEDEPVIRELFAKLLRRLGDIETASDGQEALDKVKDHFLNPRNVGEIKNADGVGTVGNPTCGDVMTVYIEVKTDKIKNIKMKLKMNEKSGHMKLAFYYTPLSVKINEIRQEEFYDNSFKLFPVDKNRKPETLPSIPLLRF